MTLTITIPGLGKPKTVKDAVISILAKEWPLTTRKLHNDVRGMGISATYQAVHKALRELENEEVVRKVGKDYRINEKWLGRVRELGESVSKSYEKGAVSLDGRKEVENFTFHNVFDMYKFILDVSLEIQKSCMKEDDICATHYRHMWWTLVGAEKEHNQFREILTRTKNHYFACKGDTFADRMIAKFYASAGAARVKTGLECAQDCDIMAAGGHVIQIYLPEDVKKSFDDVYGNFQNMSEDDLKKFYDRLLHKKTYIDVVIIKNPSVAEKIIERTLKMFKTAKG
jgi:hypothetical protein